MDWHNFFYPVFNFFEDTIIFYVAAISSTYFVLMTLGYFALRGAHARFSRVERAALLQSRMLPSISVLAPAYNEALNIRQSIRAMLKLQYPDIEVIVINDGSTDDTLQILIDEFRLYKSSRQPSQALPTMPIRAIYESREPIRLVVVDKEHGGGKADALNAGLNAALSSLVAAVDADSLLEPDALLYVVEPFLEDPEGTLAAGGIVRVVNGCEVEHGRVTRVSTPRSILAQFQAVEYLRAFLGGRIAFSFLNSVLLVSGAFGLFRREALVQAGGFATKTVGEDMEVVVRFHKLWRKDKKKYRIVFVGEPVCWTEAPEKWESLRIQRNRWQRGTVESLRMHRGMFLNPKFGMVGLFGFPYFVFFEMLGPPVELLGYAVTIIGLLLHLIAIHTAILFFAVSIFFGILLSVSAVLLEEFTSRRYSRPLDVARLLGAAALENLGIRQLLAVWRTQGLIDGIRGKQGWGKIERQGFQYPRERFVQQ